MDASKLSLILWSVLAFWVLGQIWVVQIVIYPLFARVGRPEYIEYHSFYSSRIPLPIIIPGFLSFLMPIPLAIYGPQMPTWLSVANIAAGIAGLLVTVSMEIPRHAKLQKNGKSDATIKELIRFNWPRTASITAQSIITVLMLIQVFG